MSRCQSVAIELTPWYWPGYLPCWDGPLSVREEERGGRGGHGWMDDGVERWRGDSPPERARVGAPGDLKGPFGPLN